MLRVSNLVKKYKEKVILEDIRMTVADASKIYVLRGKSGSGKTTLFNIIFGLDKEFKGSYQLFQRESKDITDQEWNQLRSHDIRIVFQEYKLIEALTVYENVYYSGIFSKDEIENVLREMDLLELKNAAIYNLSGGQKQRVAIARAVIGKPKIILLDEPTGNLDGMTAEIVMDYLKRLRDKGILIFIITHDERIVQDADVVYKLENRQVTLEKGVVEANKEKKANGGSFERRAFKHIIRYTFVNVLRTKKKLCLLGIPIIILLMLFILGFVAYQNASTVSFQQFFSGIDDRIISLSTSMLNQKTVAELNDRQIATHHDGYRIGFSDEDIKNVKKINHVEQVEVVLEGVTSEYDHKGNRLNEIVMKEEFPKALRQHAAALSTIDNVAFHFEAMSIPYSVMNHYNSGNITLISGDFPREKSNQLLVPDIYAAIKTNGDISGVLHKEVSLNVANIDSKETLHEKYIISGVYQTTYQNKIEDNYALYVGYFNQLDKEDRLSEESYDYHQQAYNFNKGTKEYSENITKSYDAYKKAVGTGLDKMILVVDHQKNMRYVHKKLAETFPQYRFISQYELKNGELSSIYFTLLLTLIIGSTLISLVMGIVIVFLNKSQISSRSYELAILYSQGYSKADIVKSIVLENSLLFGMYLTISYLSVTIIHVFFLSKTRYFYLFKNLSSIKNIFSIFMLVLIMVCISVFWGVIGVNRKNLIKNLNKQTSN